MYVIANGIKGNFDVAGRNSFAVVVAVINDSSGNIIMAATQRLHLFYGYFCW
jgi:hypothetical protein